MAFFEQIGKRLTDAGQNVAQQTKDLADVTKLKTAISEKEKKISQLFLSLGQTYYERHKADSNAESRNIIAEINQLYAEIVVNHEKIKVIKGVVKCESCGADVPISAAFCNACGARVNHTESVGTGDRLCPACHSLVADGNLFCNHCGAKIENEHE